MAQALSEGLKADLHLQQFRDVDSLIQSLEESTQVPDYILSDFNMPGKSGEDLLHWLKRHPKFHRIPFFMVSADQEQKDIDKLLRDGVTQYLPKPIEGQKIINALHDIDKNGLHRLDSDKLDQSFAEEALDSTETTLSGMGSVTEQTMQQIKIVLHTIKGNAAALQFNSLSNYIHTAEDFLECVVADKLYHAEKIQAMIHEILNYVRAQCENILHKKILDPIPEQQTAEMGKILENIRAGWSLRSTAAASRQVSPNAQTTTDPETVRTANGVRISNQKLDELQAKLKKIASCKVKLSTIVNQLKQEFFDEQFPTSMATIIDELNQHTFDLLDYFISVRTVSVSDLSKFCKNLFSETAKKLDRKADFKIIGEDGMEIDQTTNKCLEDALTHLIRNSLDHGLESPDHRKQAGKPEEGTISVSIKCAGSEIIEVSFEDDGAGTDPEKIEASILSKNIMDQESLSRIPAAKLLDLIFVDGLSTKEAATEISGRGVGMSAVKSRIQDLKGSIQVFSTVGQGTQFVIRLPRIFRLWTY